MVDSLLRSFLKKGLVVVAIVVISLAASWALFRPAFYRAHDYIHVARIGEMARALGDGQFPVIWSQNFGYGYGMPLFEFYAPLPYYVGALLYFLGVPAVASVKLLIIISTLATAIGGYLLGKKLFGTSAGLIMSAAVTLAPYRAVNIFIRGALSETWGMMAMPWILYGAVKVIHQEKDGWIWLATSSVVLMLSHNISTMIFLPFLIVFSTFYAGYRKWVVQKTTKSQLQTFVNLTAYLSLAAGLAAFYMMPALLEKDFTKVNQIFGGYFDYRQHFLYIRQFFRVAWGYTGSVWGPDDGISFFLGWGQFMGTAIWVLLMLKVLWQWIRKPHLRKASFQQLAGGAMIGLLVIGALLMTTFKSAPIWQVLPALSFAQFPWRFLSVATVFLGLLVASTLSLIVKKNSRRIVAGVLLIGMLVNGQYFHPQNYLEDNNSLYYTDSDRIQKEMSGILPDYIPAQMSDDLTPPEQAAWCQMDCSEQPVVLTQNSHQLLIETNFTDEQVVELAIADFPGWQLEIDGHPSVHYQSPQGNVAVLVPAGAHKVAAYFGPSRIRMIANGISMVSILIYVYLLMINGQYSKRGNIEKSSKRSNTAKHVKQKNR